MIRTDEMLASVLGDPESMQQIKELAQMLSEQTNGDSPSAGLPEDHPDNDSAQTSDSSQTAGSQSGSLDGLNGLFGAGGIDLNTIMNIGKVLSAAGGEDKNTALLLALKPHLSEQRQQRADKAVKMLKMYSIFLALKDSGMLGQLL
ncbi:MAG: hypothetical protein NC078_03565 [Ruminococcus sp.]|nr:hypothetical protein [Ruminococcus sp.]